MAYPQKLLAPGEVIQFEMRPHWRVVLLPTIALLALVFSGFYLFGKFGTWFDGSTEAIMRTLLIVVWFGLLIYLVVVPYARWLTAQYVFTNRRIITREGVLHRQGRDVPLDKINNVSFDTTFIERIFHAGTLRIESASDSGALAISDVPDLEVVQRKVYELVDANRRENMGLPPREVAEQQAQMWANQQGQQPGGVMPASGAGPQAAQPGAYQPTQAIPQNQPTQGQPPQAQPPQGQANPSGWNAGGPGAAPSGDPNQGA